MWTLLVFLWIVSGWASCVWLVTGVNDFTRSDLVGTFFVGGVLGPIIAVYAFAAWFLFKPTNNTVIFKKRNSK